MNIVLDYASVDCNKPPDFVKAREWGVTGLYIRGSCGYVLDSTLKRDADNAIKAGLTVSSYAAIVWDKDPVLMATQFIKAYSPDKYKMPPALDVEFPGKGISDTGITPEEALKVIEDMVSYLSSSYGDVLIYTSARVWEEDLKNIKSSVLSSCGLWLKVPYPWKARNNPHLDSACKLLPFTGPLPIPWARRPGKPESIKLIQFQGDALNVPGFSSTVDLNIEVS